MVFKAEAKIGDESKIDVAVKVESEAKREAGANAKAEAGAEVNDETWAKASAKSEAAMGRDPNKIAHGVKIYFLFILAWEVPLGM